MPTISMFYGIIVRMYFAPGEHNPPHFHVYYNEYKASVDIRMCEIIDGNLPPKATEAGLGMGRTSPGRADGRLEPRHEGRKPIQDSTASVRRRETCTRLCQR